MALNSLDSNHKLSYDSSETIRVCINPASTSSQIEEALSKTPMDEFERTVKTILLQAPQTPLYTLENLAYFFINHYETLPPFLTILTINHPNVSPEIVTTFLEKILTEYIEEKNKKEQGFSFSTKISYGAEIIKTLILHPLTTPNQLGIIFNTTGSYKTQLMENPKTPESVITRIMSEGMVNNTAFEAFRHPNLNLNVAADLLRKNRMRKTTIEELQKRNDWKTILLKAILPYYPETKETLPLSWLEELYISIDLPNSNQIKSNHNHA